MKPTYAELEKRVAELERKVAERPQVVHHYHVDPSWMFHANQPPRNPGYFETPPGKWEITS